MIVLILILVFILGMLILYYKFNYTSNIVEISYTNMENQNEKGEEE